MYQNRLQEIDELKSKIDSFRPLSDNILKQIKAYFKISFTYTSNAIEGNTLSLSETKIIIEDGITIGGKPVKGHFEIDIGTRLLERRYTCPNKNFWN